MTTLRLATVALVFTLAGGAAALDVFSLVASSTTTGMNQHGITWDGAAWNISNFSGMWSRYDASFVSIGSVPFPPGIGEIRGIAFDVGSGNFFLGDYGASFVREVTPAGALVSQFNANVPSSMNAVAVNHNDGTLFLVSYASLVNHVDRTGALLGSFTTPGIQWTGAAYDTFRDSLLLLETNADVVYEYSPTGTQIGLVIGSDSVADNGQGLNYDSATGVLHVTGQSGPVWVWSRMGGGATPPTCMLTAPASPAAEDIDLLIDTASTTAATLDLTFEVSTDSGTTWSACTAAAASALANPATGVPTGMAVLTWDSVADGIALTGAQSVVARATASDGVTMPTVCTATPFMVDNSLTCTSLCGDCNQNAVGPDILDALMAAQLAAALVTPTVAQATCCDVDTSGTITILDALRIAQVAAALPVTATCP